MQVLSLQSSSERRPRVVDVGGAYSRDAEFVLLGQGGEELRGSSVLQTEEGLESTLGDGLVIIEILTEGQDGVALGDCGAATCRGALKADVALHGGEEVAVGGEVDARHLDVARRNVVVGLRRIVESKGKTEGADAVDVDSVALQELQAQVVGE